MSAMPSTVLADGAVVCIGPVGKVARVSRIVCGSVLFGGMLLLTGVIVYGLAKLGPRFDLAIPGVLTAALTYLCGRILVWRGVIPLEELFSGRGLPGADEGGEGAGRLAPLRPIAPRFLSAAAELPRAAEKRCREL